LLGEPNELLARHRAQHVARVAVAVPIKRGTAEPARQLVEEAPPFAIEALGLAWKNAIAVLVQPAPAPEERPSADAADQPVAETTKLEAQDARLDSVVSEYQSQFSTAQESRQTEFSQALEEAKAQIRTSIEQSEQTIEEAVNEAKGNLSSLLEDTRTTTEDALGDVKEKAEEQQEELEKRSEDRIKQLDSLLEKAVKTVGAIGSTGMAGGYQLVANDEKKAANSWRRWAVAALLGAIGATVFAVAHGISNGFHVDTFFAKWAVSIPFAALAAYAGVESSKHREQARINRQIELQLASLDAYLATLPETEQTRVRAKLADRFFGELYPGPHELPPPADDG
jgi:vacuolar-type H+-ATPase subunit H